MLTFGFNGKSNSRHFTSCGLTLKNHAVHLVKTIERKKIKQILNRRSHTYSYDKEADRNNKQLKNEDFVLERFNVAIVTEENSYPFIKHSCAKFNSAQIKNQKRNKYNGVFKINVFGTETINVSRTEAIKNRYVIYIFPTEENFLGYWNTAVRSNSIFYQKW